MATDLSAGDLDPAAPPSAVSPPGTGLLPAAADGRLAAPVEASAPAPVGTPGPAGASGTRGGTPTPVGAPARPPSPPAPPPGPVVPPTRRGGTPTARPRARRPGPGTWALVAVVAVGAVLRFTTGSHLWLDEALTVEIARRPLGGLFHALRHDGAPPLYYLLLHVWIKVFGDGDVVVRALSGVLSLVTVPVAWLAGRRVGRVSAAFGNGDPRTAQWATTAALLLFASSPYAIRYGSETRMYSAVVLLVLVLGLALVRTLERPGWRRRLPLALTTAALAYTHYWTFLLLGSVALFLLVQSRRRLHYRQRCRRALGAMLVSGVLFVPWLPTFSYQMLHTGTPWAPRVHAQVLLDTVYDWAGPTSTGALLGLLLLVAAFVGLTARPHGDGLHVDLRGRVPGRYLAALWLLPLVLAYLAYLAGGSAYAERYTGVSLPAFLLLAALGVALLPSRRLRVGVLAVACLSGLLGGFDLVRRERTQAGSIAAKIEAQARPGDVVAYCPDQLGPAVHRALHQRDGPPLREVAFADPAGPALVDWVDYATRMRRASGADFAARVHALAGPDNAIFFVRADGYRTLEGSCAVVSDQLAALRDRSVLEGRRPLLEGGSLERFSTTR